MTTPPTLRRLAALALAATVACSPSPDTARRAADPDHAADETPTNRIAIPASVRDNLGITFVAVEARHVARTLRVPGAFELRPSARREYRVPLPGQVDLLVDQYERVEAGQPLFRYRSPEWSALVQAIVDAERTIATRRAEVDVARALLDEHDARAEVLAARLDALADAAFRRADLEADAAELDATRPRLEAELQLAQTRVSTAERGLDQALRRAEAATGIARDALTDDGDADGVPAFQRIDWIEVAAVDAGVVDRLAVSNGAFVEPSTAILSVVDLDGVRFRAEALQADLPRLLDATAASIVPPASPGFSPTDAVAAALSVGVEADPSSRTVTLLAQPESVPPWARPGVSAFVEIVVAGGESAALAIPEAAVVRDGLAHVFFRRDPADPNQAIRVEADLGTSDGRWVVLQSGVRHGDEVVLDGVYELKLATQQTGAAQRGGHFHADGSFHAEN